MYSFLEQHNDGSWWYHPGCTYETEGKAKQGFKKMFWWDLDRPHKIISHSIPFPQDISRCTFDMVHFNFAGGKFFTLQ